MNFTAKITQKIRERYWMHELRTIFLNGLYDRKGDGFKTDNTHINVASNFSFLSRKLSCANCVKNQKGFPRHYNNSF